MRISQFSSTFQIKGLSWFSIMKLIICLTLLCFLQKEVLSIYATNSTNVQKAIENNPAVWTETAVWGPILEEWVTNNHR